MATDQDDDRGSSARVLPTSPARTTADAPEESGSARDCEAEREERERRDIAVLVAEMDATNGPADEAAVQRATELLS